MLGGIVKWMSATSGDRGSALVCERWVPHRGRERDMAYWSCRPQIIRHPTTLVTMETRISKRGCIPVPSFTLLLGAGTARLQTQAKASKAGGLMKLRHPAPKSFMNRQEDV
jgi:hypothetical protein